MCRIHDLIFSIRLIFNMMSLLYSDSLKSWNWDWQVPWILDECMTRFSFASCVLASIDASSLLGIFCSVARKSPSRSKENQIMIAGDAIVLMICWRLESCARWITPTLWSSWTHMSTRITITSFSSSCRVLLYVSSSQKSPSLFALPTASPGCRWSCRGLHICTRTTFDTGT